MTLLTPPEDSGAALRAATRFAATAHADVRIGELDTPAGRVLAAMTDRGLVRLAYLDTHGGADAVVDDLAARLSPRILERPDAFGELSRELEQYFTGSRRAFDLAIDWSLVPGFGRRVLRATARIPYGEVATYGEVAALAGSPGGARATGNALGANPIPIVVPCHRVVRAGGALGGYTGGVERKELLLGVEAGGLTA
jgi:methylated-DNA-[protein]-cysteine S-methyltransferase